jgi:hypothetical protein
MSRTRSDCLFLAEGEIAARVGMTSLEWQAAAVVLERSGLPGRDPLFGNRRYWPAVKAYLERRAGLGHSVAQVPDGAENWNEGGRKPRAGAQGFGSTGAPYSAASASVEFGAETGVAGARLRKSVP